MNETTKDAKAIDNTITLKDVKAWFANNVKRRTHRRVPTLSWLMYHTKNID